MESGRSGEFCYNPDANYDEAIMQQQRQIENEIAESQPLIGKKESLNVLMKEFDGDLVYQEKVKKLQACYSFLRRTRGDGNCFYRAFGFAYMEQLLQDKNEFSRFRPLAEKSKDELVTLGFPQFTIEDFHSVFMEVLDKVGAGCSVDELVNTFNDQGYSDYIVVYLRLLVSGHLQKENEFYSSFVEGNRTIKEFCSQEVEPMGKESDHVHIISLTSATQVPVRIEYMDRGNASTPSVNHHDFPDGSNPHLRLLYRPGHYDILYL